MLCFLSPGTGEKREDFARHRGYDIGVNRVDSGELTVIVKFRFIGQFVGADALGGPIETHCSNGGTSRGPSPTGCKL